MPDSELPPLALLDEAPTRQEMISAETLEFTSRLIERKLKDFGVEVKVIAAYPGPVITRYEIEPAVGVKGSQIVNLSKDLNRALGTQALRVVETIAGKTCMGLEVPNPKRQMISLSEILSSQVYNASSSLLTLALGKDIAGQPMVADLAKMPHCLVAGTTGSGKSVGINAMILSLLFKAKPDEVRLILIDPKMLEMAMYEDIPHLLTPVVTDMKQASNALQWAVKEMDRRYKLMSKFGVRNLAGFNRKLVKRKQLALIYIILLV
jgi:S-DNA-T family DNA segregation ATPase FtsK/SpoIIIE